MSTQELDEKNGFFYKPAQSTTAQTISSSGNPSSSRDEDVSKEIESSQNGRSYEQDQKTYHENLARTKLLLEIKFLKYQIDHCIQPIWRKPAVTIPFLSLLVMIAALVVQLLQYRKDIDEKNQTINSQDYQIEQILVDGRYAIKPYGNGLDRVLLKGFPVEITTQSYTGLENRVIEEHISANFFCLEKGNRKVVSYEYKHFSDTQPSWRFSKSGDKVKFPGKSSFTKIICI